MVKQTDQRSAGTDVRLLLVGGGVVLIVVVAVVVVLLAGRNTTQFPADSPQGILQRYLTALEERDFEAAWAYFSDRIHDEFEFDDFERSMRMYGTPGGDAPAPRVLFDRISGSGDRVRVHVVVEHFHGGGIGGGDTYRSPHEIPMVLQADGWRIDEPLTWLDAMPFDEPF